jgi:hypothetical protein
MMARSSKAGPMTQASFERGEWQAVIDAHPLESHDPAEWLRYGAALLHTIEPGLEQGRQQQQVALAFVQAQKEGASEGAVRDAQRRAVLLQLGAGLLISGSREQRLQLLDAGQPEWLPQRERPGRARLLAERWLLDAGAWKEAETLHAEAVRAHFT